jgi:diguanylate cyclase
MGTTSRRWDTAGLVVLLSLGAFALIAIQLSGSARSLPLFTTVAGGAQLVFALLGLAFALRTAMRGRSLPRHLKRAWWLMLPVYALWPVTIVLYAVFPGQPFPSPPDVFRLLIAPATLIGILAFARMPRTAAERAKLTLDAALVAVGTAMVLWYLVVSPALTESDATWREIVPSIFHPLFGAALLFGISVALMRGPGAASARRPMLVVVASIVLTLTGDTLRAWVVNTGGPLMPSPLQNSLWTGGIFLFMLAPYVQCWYCRRPGLMNRGTDLVPKSRTPRWPYLAVIPGYALLVATVPRRAAGWPSPTG